MSTRRSFLARLAWPILLLALIVCSLSGVRWYRSYAVRRHFERADDFVNQRKGPQAEAEWQAVLHQEPNNTAALELLGEYYMSRQNWPAGADAFRRLGQVAPKMPHVQCRLAACLLRMDDQKQAFQVAEAELKRDPNCVAALGLVTTLMAQRPGTEQKQQMEYLRRLARLTPDDPMVLRMLAEQLSSQYKYEELRPVLAHMIRIDARDAEAYNLLGFADLARPDQPLGAQDAIRDFQISLQCASANSGAHFGLGRAYRLLGDAPNAVLHLEEAAHGLPMVARVQQELAVAYRLNHDREKAESAQARFIALERQAGDERMLIVRCTAFPDDPSYPRRLGQLYLKLGDPSRALYYLSHAQQMRPQDAELATLVATATEAATRQNLAIPEGVR
ncbi:MAG TPA: tetratricopeptide repeat protein [Chthonomonadaceae bacterium]|nr:tetratricopeptide repeat protein [Chthonomonadaceae bacterium]